MAKLIMIMGLPGAGKTTHANQLYEKKNEKTKKIHLDDMRNLITGTYKPGEHDAFVYKMAQTTVLYYLKKGEDVILDAAFLSRNVRAKYVEIAKSCKASAELHWMDPALDVIYDRLQKRNQNEREDRVIGQDYVERLSRMLEFPTKEEGFDRLEHVN